MNKFNDAINIGLQIIGEQTLEDGLSIEGIYEAEQMSLLIDTTKDEVLSTGWTFNTDYAWTLSPDEDGYILIADDILRIDASDTTNIVRRNGKLYDKENQTDIFEDSVDCDIIWNIDFDELPPIMQSYITLKASRLLYQRLVGDANMLEILIRDEQEALLRVKEHEDDVGDYNIFDNPTVSRILTRNSNSVGVRG